MLRGKRAAFEAESAVVVKDVKTGDKHTVPCGAMFVAIGHTPMTDLVKGQLDIHDNGYIKVKPGTAQTSIPGVFAAGDVADWQYRQAVTAAGMGCMAALEADRFLAQHETSGAATSFEKTAEAAE